MLESVLEETDDSEVNFKVRTALALLTVVAERQTVAGEALALIAIGRYWSVDICTIVEKDPSGPSKVFPWVPIVQESRALFFTANRKLRRGTEDGFTPAHEARHTVSAIRESPIVPQRNSCWCDLGGCRLYWTDSTWVEQNRFRSSISFQTGTEVRHRPRRVPLSALG